MTDSSYSFVKTQYDQYFLSYSGTKLPLKLVGELGVNEIENRNTYFGLKLDEHGRQKLIHKIVYGEVELEHKYGYDDEGRISWAEVRNLEEELQRIEF